MTCLDLEGFAVVKINLTDWKGMIPVEASSGKARASSPSAFETMRANPVACVATPKWQLVIDMSPTENVSFTDEPDAFPLMNIYLN